MVRVNDGQHGGGCRSETKREPKTVRILKPPGGGSSIYFGEEEPIRKPSTPTSPTTNGSSPAKTPVVEAEETKIVNKKTSETPTPPPETAETPKEEEVSDEVKKEENGVEKLESTPAAVAVATPKKTNGTVSNGTPNPPSSPVTLEPIPLVDNSSEENSQNGTIHAEAVKKFVDDTTVSNHEAEEKIVVSSQNGTKHNLPPLKIVPKSQSVEASSPTVTSPSSSNGDTKDRLFGDNDCCSNTPTTTSPQVETPNRKIKDHMRSNIFMSSPEEYPIAPSRYSKPDAKVKSPEVQEPSRAGQRGRVPPGGFSSKLW